MTLEIKMLSSLSVRHSDLSMGSLERTNCNCSVRSCIRSIATLQIVKRVKVEFYWHDKHYLIIDEISMVSREMFSKLSNNIDQVRVRHLFSSEALFDAILVVDFHEFPPVASGMPSPLRIPCNPAEDSTLEMLGRKLYEKFDIVVQSTTQLRVTYCVLWVDLLRRARYVECHKEDLKTHADSS